MNITTDTKLNDDAIALIRTELDSLAEAFQTDTISILSELLEIVNDNAGTELYAVIRGNGLELFDAMGEDESFLLSVIQTGFEVLNERD